MALIGLSPRAERDLINLWQYIADESSDTRADAFLDRVLNKLELLAEQPGIGRQRDELKPNLRSHPIGRYVVFYFPLDDGIDVVRVLYGGRDIDAVFADEEDS